MDEGHTLEGYAGKEAHVTVIDIINACDDLARIVSDLRSLA